MATTHRALHPSQISVLFVSALFLIVPITSVHAQAFYGDGAAGISSAYNTESSNALQQDEDELQSNSNALEQSQTNLDTSESNLKAEYGLTAYYTCYSASSICSTDTGSPLVASECTDALQSCLENNELATEKAQAEAEQIEQSDSIASPTTCPMGSLWSASQSACEQVTDPASPSATAQATCLLRSNSEWNSDTQTCDCASGFQLSPDGNSCILSLSAIGIPSDAVPTVQTDVLPVTPPTLSIHVNQAIQAVATSNLSVLGAEPPAMPASSTSIAQNKVGVSSGFWTTLLHLLDPFSWFR